MDRGRRIVTVLSVLMAAALLWGCSADTQKTDLRTAAESEEEDQDIRIGISFDSFVIERWLRDRDVFTATAQSLGAQVADLQSQINSMESSVNQNQYDKDSALRDLDAANAQLASATEENETLRDQLATAQSDLETCQADLEEAQADNEALTEENESLSSQVEEMETKVDFYDTYVVFVNQGTTDRYYHKYSCPDFSRQQFVAYSPKLAESNGYHPCPVCCGGTELPEQTTGIFGGLFG